MELIESLSWDSNFFGKRIGKFLIYDENTFDASEFLFEAKQNFDLVYVFSFQKMLSFQKVHSSNLELVDIMLTMSMPFNKDLYVRQNYEFKTVLTEKEIDECYEIAEEISVVSRFYNEKTIGHEKTKNLYRKWIDNALNKSFSDGMFFVKDLNTIIGIHLIKTDIINKIGYFTLTGVNPNYKRIGLGKKLWEQSFGYFSNITEIEIIKSPFSFQNIESFNFHLKMGFKKVEEIKYIYHFRNDYK